MNGVSFQHLVLPEVLREVGKDLLIEFCGHFTSELAAKNLALPSRDLPDDDYYQSLASLLQCPAALPNSFKEALFDIEEMAIPERSDCLKEAVAKAGVEGIRVEGVCHERVALQLWLARPDLLLASEKHQAHLTSFEGFASGVAAAESPPLAPPQPATLEEMSARMHLWFLQRNPQAPKVRIQLYITNPGEYWFLISRGDTCRWIYNFQQQKVELIHFGPLGEEAIVCLAFQNQIWIASKTSADGELYRQQFGLYLRGDADYFSQRYEICLDPLRTEGVDTVDPADLEGITAIKFCRDEVDWGGAGHALTTNSAEDMFEPGRSIPEETTFIPKSGSLTSARFLVQFADCSRPRVVEIAAPHSLELERASDVRTVVHWFSKRGLVQLPGTKPALSKAA